ncbi:bucentaur or craniofacial development-domain-containing protein [Crepidotus variabilis]|uniref:SWR1-complex protein 5 n=1 Tax=Crepidotus variabilis TaxID=179855 RepID=A0A9P6JP66_9AGAR|nr:bucentaur or craniofacial development-domain-containing protein [Crepidotus variabilis]
MLSSVPNNNPAVDSGSEDDEYVPHAGENGANSPGTGRNLNLLSEDSSDESVQEVEEKAVPLIESNEDVEEKKRKRDTLWSDFQASIINNSTKPSDEPPKKKIKVEKKYRFAGKETIEVVEVVEDSPDARQWPLWRSPTIYEAPAPTSVDVLSSQNGSSEPIPLETAPTTSPLLVPPSESSKTATVPPEPRLPSKKPGPRKPKTALASLPGSTKAKKISTLDKSAMDWQAHLQSEKASGSSIQDELQANRRGGGYLEKVEFLKRVEDRKEEQLDALKGSKRRKL